MTNHTFVVENEDTGKRLDVFISQKLQDLTRSYINKLISENEIKVNNAIKKSGYKLKLNDRIDINIPAPKVLSTEAEDLPIDIIYEDDDLAIVNKAKGMVTHPAVGSYNGTLVNALLYHLKSLSTINGVIRPGIVHRLDKDTSGLLVIAKNDKAHLSLAKQIETKSAKRIYLAICDGNIKEEKGEIVQPIGRSKRDRKKMAVVDGGRFAHTDYTVLEHLGSKCLVEFSLRTGRTHQIRVHCRYINHPITGDDTYGGDLTFKTKGQLLHAYKLIIQHPTTGKIMEFEAPLPEEFSVVLDKLRKKIN